MSLTEFLAAILKLSVAERQQFARRTIEVEEDDPAAEEKAILNERLEDFRGNRGDLSSG